MQIYSLTYLFFYILFSSQLWAEQSTPSPTAIPFSRSYSPIDYQGQNQTFDSLVQKSTGFLYVANSIEGVLEFDGENWRTLTLDNKNSAFSLYEDKNNDIYVAGLSEVGVIKTNNGVATYQRILKDVPDYALKGILQVSGFEDQLVFMSSTHIITFNPSTDLFNIIPHPEENHIIFEGLYPTSSGVWTSDSEGSIYQVSNDQLNVLFRENTDFYGGHIFRNDYGLRAILFIVQIDKRWLIGSSIAGLILFDGTYMSHFKTDIDQNLIGQLSPSAFYSAKNELWLGTPNQGIFVIDENGQHTNTYNKDNALESNSVSHLNPDDHGNVWICTSFGITQIKYPLAFQRYDSSAGFTGQVRRLISFDQHYFLSSSMGAFVAESKENDLWHLHFNRISGIPSSETSGISVDEYGAWISNMFGLYLYSFKPLQQSTFLSLIQQTDKAWLYLVKPLENQYCRWIEHSTHQKNILFVGTANGQLHRLKLEPSSNWAIISSDNIGDPIIFGFEKDDGTLWLGGYQNGAYQITWPQSPTDKVQIRSFVDECYPPDSYTLSKLDNIPFLYSDRNQYVFSENENTFVKGSGSWKLPNQLGTISQYEDRLWLTYGKPRKLAYIDKKYGDLHKIDRLNRFQVRHIETRPNGDLWMAADLSLIHYQAHTSSPSNIKPDISFRKFSINNKTQWGLNKDVSDTSNAPMIFDYQHNSAQFEFSSSGLDVDFKDTYRTKITGLGEEGWTDWSRKTHVEFIDLSPGKYVFNIQSKDFKGQKSITKPFEFEILPPWWETIWFYTLQFSFLVSLMILSMFLNRTGRISRFSKILSYTVLIAVFETIMMILDPYKGMLGFGVPAIQLGFNVAFAITLEPAQALFQKIVNDTKAIN